MRRPTETVKEIELCGRKYAGKPSWKAEAGAISLRVWRRRYCIEASDYHHRQVDFSISEMRHLIGAGNFVEWRGPRSVS